ncbi:acyl carrier protein [Crossiella sp. SN42]|uniref:acyl carrier protein n=1 Tax=Crossiella sp. SN42 TaxID=2944808 RepID=UPI00207D37B6|nr:acyl carrier protein [Crossiella sp. SN42]MCO1580344.1 acyl carrier protein [Crossiella sp. SN42]
MSGFTLIDLKKVLTEAAGEENADLAAGLDTPLADLGYDSLAKLEVAALLRRAYRLPVPDEAVDRMTTPRETVAYLNDLAGQA